MLRWSVPGVHLVMVNSFKRWLTRPNFPFHSGECETSIYAAFQNKRKDKSKRNNDVSVNYRKHFTDFTTFLFPIKCCYIYSVQDVLNTSGVVVSLSTHVLHPSNLLYSWTGSDYSPGDWSKHSHSFLSHSARMFLPSHIFPPTDSSF